MASIDKLGSEPTKSETVQDITKKTDKDLDNLKELSGPELLSEFITTVFQDTEIGNFFKVLFGELETSNYDDIDRTVRGNIDKYKAMGSFDLLCQEQAKKGTLALLFLQLPEGGFMNPSYTENKKYKIDFMGNTEAEKNIGLSDIISDTEVSVIEVDHGGQKVFARRTFAQGKPMYAECDKEGNVLYPHKKVSVFSGDFVTVIKRSPMNKQELAEEAKYKQEYINTRQYQETARMRRSSVEVNHPPTGTENTKKSQDVWQQVFNYYKRGIPVKDQFIRERLKVRSWGVCCYNLANAISFAINKKGVSGGTKPMFDAYGKHGPKLDTSKYKMGTDVEKLINDESLKPGTVFHISTSGDYMSMRGSNHWFTFVERGPDGKCLFADQAGYAVPLSQVCSPARPLLAVY